jgi:hypothetical protein
MLPPRKIPSLTLKEIMLSRAASSKAHLTPRLLRVPVSKK